MDIKFGFSGQKDIESNHTYQLCISKNVSVTQWIDAENILQNFVLSSNTLYKTL